MAQAKGDRQAGKKSVEDNFDEMLKVFEGDEDLQGQICESSTSVSFFIYIYILAIVFMYSKKASVTYSLYSYLLSFVRYTNFYSY